MTAVKIDRRLALAIGYTADRVLVATFWHKGHYTEYVQVLNDNSRMDGPMQYSAWQRFDHTDPAVIWPIAERFNAFPYLVAVGKKARVWNALCGSCSRSEKQHKHAATASALAVIKYLEARK